MNLANISQVGIIDLPHSLKRAQEAMHLPEVQEMLRRLSEYQLGIFMPHLHDETTGEFKVLPDEFMQVESGLSVTFKRTEEMAIDADRFLPVSWMWRAGAVAPASVCEMVWEERHAGTKREAKHKMPAAT